MLPSALIEFSELRSWLKAEQRLTKSDKQG